MAIPRTTIYWSTGTGGLGLSLPFVTGMKKMGIENSLFGCYVYEGNLAVMEDSPIPRELGRRFYKGPPKERIRSAYGKGGSREKAELSREDWEPILDGMVNSAISDANAAHLDEILEIVVLTPQSAGHSLILEELILKRNRRKHLGATRIGLAILPEESDKRRRLATLHNPLVEMVDKRIVDIVIILDNDSPYAQSLGGWHQQDTIAMEAFTALLAGIFANTAYRSGVDIATTLHEQMSLTCFGLAHMPVSPIKHTGLVKLGRNLIGMRDELNPLDVVNSVVEAIRQAITDPNCRTLGDETPYDTDYVTYGVAIIPAINDPKAINMVEARVKRQLKRDYPNLELAILPGNPSLPPGCSGHHVLAGVILPMPDEPSVLRNIRRTQAMIQARRGDERAVTKKSDEIGEPTGDVV